MSWNPLSDTLLSSSVLAEGPDVVAIWALLMASADRDGVSVITSPFVASVLRISDERADAAFKVLLSPDPKSRNKDAEGRRIVPVDGGWMLVSHAKYRQSASKQKAADSQAKYAAKRRALQERSAVCDVPECGEEVAGAAGGQRMCSEHAFGLLPEGAAR